MSIRVPGTTLRMGSSRVRCLCCGRQMLGVGQSPDAPTWDHIRPRAWGGDDEMDNFRRVCRACNELRAMAGHCVGALACARAVMGGGYVHYLLRRWFPNQGRG